MIRRSFRIGLTLGLLGGLAFALVKMFGPRPEPAASHAPVPTEPVPTEPWPRLQADPAQPAPATVALVPDPAAPPPAGAAPRVAAPAAKAAPPKAAAKKAPPATKAPVAKQAPVAKKAPAAVKTAPAKKKPLMALWVEPKGNVCPTSHPVKAKLTSKIFHLPGMLNYERSKPDRCYRDATAAEADGLRPAKK